MTQEEIAKPKDYWNYRLLRMKSGEYDYFFITEVHYRNGNPVSYKPYEARHEVGTDEENPKSALRWTLKKMREALSKHTLDAENWPNRFNPNKTN